MKAIQIGDEVIVPSMYANDNPMVVTIKYEDTVILKSPIGKWKSYYIHELKMTDGIWHI